MTERGRPSKYTPERISAILDAIRLGVPRELAARASGINPDTFYTWQKEKPEFSDAVNEAEAKSTLALVAKVQKAASDGNWTAAAWMLERRFPKQFGRLDRSQVELTGKDGGPVQVSKGPDLSKLTDAELAQMEALLAKSSRTDD